MSRYQSTNPFEDDDDDGDDKDFVLVNKGKPAATYTFNTDGLERTSAPVQPPTNQTRPQPSNLTRHTQQSSSYGRDTSANFGNGSSDPFEDRLHHLQTQIDQSEHRQLETTQRCLASIYDSEAMGVATAEELVRQGEMLDNIEQKTDGMQNTLTTSQKHINNIKSVFGGIKNWWSKGEKKTPAEDAKHISTSNRLKSEIDKQTKYDTSGFRDDDKDLDARFMAGASSRKPGDGQYKMIQPVTRSAREEELDYNLDMMGAGMARLKGLAQGLGDEIESQNEQLDRINVKVEDTDNVLSGQNKQMKKILKR